MLLFKKKLLPAIRCGEKTQTIGLWKHRHMWAGQRSYIPGVEPIRVTVVEEVAIDELTDANSAPDWLRLGHSAGTELRTIYGDKLADGYRAFRVVFECAATR